MMGGEVRIVIGCKGEIGIAISKIFNSKYGIDTSYNYDDTVYQLAGFTKIVHICIPYVKDYVDVVIRYINKLTPDLVLIHTTCKIGTTRQIGEITNKPVVHCPVNGKHPQMIDEIKRYGFFVGAIQTKHGQMACEYIERYGIDTYLCETPEITELSKIASTELLRKIIEFYQDYKQYVREKELNWAEFIAFFDNLYRKAEDGKWIYRVFQRAGRIDTPMSRKHCISKNKELL